MTSESPLNFFSHSAKKTKKIDAEILPAEEKPRPIQKPPIPVRNFTVEAMIERMNQMRQDIDTKIEEASNKHGISKEQIVQYLSNQKNFTSEQWAFLNDKRQAFFKNIQSNLGNNSQLPGAGEGSSTTTLENRKNKLAGSRRRWIPTR